MEHSPSPADGPGGPERSPPEETLQRRESASVASAPGPRKRSFASFNGDVVISPSSDDTAIGTRHAAKGHKVSRACDFCKQRKTKCSGTLPCRRCSTKGLVCLYDSTYSRGRPPTPPPSDHRQKAHEIPSLGGNTSYEAERGHEDQSHAVPSVAHERLADSNGAPSRTSPELGMAEIEGQVFDPTSGMTFLHRAWRRLAKHGHSDENLDLPRDAASSVANQYVTSAGDKPLPRTTEQDIFTLTLPSHQELGKLISLYFDVCVATYRIVHRPSVEAWLSVMEKNLQQAMPAWQDVGRAKAAIVLACLSLATAHDEKSRGIYCDKDERRSLARSDHLFCISKQLTEAESGFPCLESAQARIIQTLYLLTTSRMNLSWHTFGSALQFISTLGLHRKTTKQRYLKFRTFDYLQEQLRIRTFWTAYILDKYLGVIFGRPRHFHDEDIDQDLPDRLEDDEMTVNGPVRLGEEQPGCHIDALISHVQISKIMGQVSREVYSIKSIPQEERIAAAHRLSKDIHDWKSALPAYLGSIRPSMLIVSFRRQTTVLKLAYCHAMMHANRPFLFASAYQGSKEQIAECIDAARSVFELVDVLAREGPIFHAFWWTQYVVFCALVITYVWDIQLKRKNTLLADDDLARHTSLMEMAQRCHTHLARATASNSPSRRYAVILDEFRSEAVHYTKWVPARSTHASVAEQEQTRQSIVQGIDSTLEMNASYDSAMSAARDAGAYWGTNILEEWDTTDWLELDSSAFGLYMDVDESSLQWMSAL